MYYLGQDSMGIQRLGVAASDDGIHWTKHANNPIMDVGVKGAFDENGLGEPSVVYKAPYFYMLYTGRNSIEQRNLGVAVSLDGIAWKKLNYQGIVDLSLNEWNSQVICDTTLLQNEFGSFDVWYGGGNIAAPAENLNGRIGLFTISLEGVADATQFNVNMDWDRGSADSTDFLKGSYAIESEQSEKSAWCTDDVSIVLENELDKDDVCVKGYLPMELHQKAGSDEVTFSFLINGELIKEIKFSEAEMFEIELPKTKDTRKQATLILQIKASSAVVPQEYKMSEDMRNLSWIVKEIWQQ